MLPQTQLPLLKGNHKSTGMTSSTGGKVGNMRALFEAKQELSSSPPSRGRSPAGSDIHSIRSGSSRPVSKIRTSFVAVEKSGNMGPMLGLRMVSDVQDKPELDTDLQQFVTRSASNAGREGIAEEEEGESKNVAERQDEDTESKQRLDKEATPAPAPDSDAKDTSSTSAPVLAKENKAAKHVPTKIKTQVNSGSSKTNGALMKKQPATPKDASGKGKAESQKPTTFRTKLSPSSPQATNMKTKTTINNSGNPGSAPKVRVRREPISKPESRVSTPRTSLASNGSKEVNSTKTRPKSPTRPVRLPAAAMASTASSAAKSNSTENTSLQSSSKPRVSSDGDFLARMMRPTAASASKTHEKLAPTSGSQKVNVSKPKKTNDISERKISGSTTRSTSIASHKKAIYQSTSLTNGLTSDSSKPEATVINQPSIDEAAGSGTGGSSKAKENSDLATPIIPDKSADITESEEQPQVTESTDLGFDEDVVPVETDAAAKGSIESRSEDAILVTGHSSLSNHDNGSPHSIIYSYGTETPKADTKADHENDNTHKDHDVPHSTERSDRREPQSAIITPERSTTSLEPPDDASLDDMMDEFADVVAEQPISDIIDTSEPNKTESLVTKSKGTEELPSMPLPTESAESPFVPPETLLYITVPRNSADPLANFPSLSETLRIQKQKQKISHPHNQL